MDKKVILTTEELGKITMGFKWDPEMSFEDFCNANPKLTIDVGYDIYTTITDKYIQYVFEDRN